MLFNKHPAIFPTLISVLVLSLSACTDGSNSDALERSVAPDPQLQDNPATFGQPSTTNPQNSTVVKLPSDFPTEIPIYPQAQLQEIKPTATPSPSPSPATQPTPANQTVLTRWKTTDPSNLVQNFYQKQFQSKGWEIESQPTENNPANASTNTLVARHNNLQVTVSIQPSSTTNSPSPTPSPSTADNSKNATEFIIEYSRNSAETSATKPSTSTTPLKPTATESPQQSEVFTDINKAPQQLRQYIQDLAALGVLTINQSGAKSTGTTSEQVEPNKVITRREYARWLAAANNQIYANSPGKQIRVASETAQPTFQDVAKTDPDFPVIQGLAEAGLIPNSLTGDSTAVLFRPDAPLTRENLILWKVPLDTRQALPNGSIDVVKQTWGFQDAAKIDPKALRAIVADFQNGEQANIRRVFGYTTLFQPQKPVTRAEAAAVLWYFGSQGEGISAKDALQLKK